MSRPSTKQIHDSVIYHKSRSCIISETYKMGSSSSRGNSASRKRKARITEAELPKKAARHSSIPTPEATLTAHANIRNEIPDQPRKFPMMAFLDCRLLIKIRSWTSKLMGSNPSVTLQQSSEGDAVPNPEPLCHDQAQVQYQNRPGHRRTITWDPTIEFKDRPQSQISNYARTSTVEVEIDWWKDPVQLKACESFLSTGKYLDAFMSLSYEDVRKIVCLLPPEIVNMVLSISAKVGRMEELMPEEYQDGVDYVDSPRTVSNADADAESEEDAREMVDCRRVLAEYFDSRLDGYLFCRYSGVLKRPASCPKRELSRQTLDSLYESTRGWGPTAHIVSPETRSDRPLISPIRFSQAYRAMKLHCLGKGSTRDIFFLDLMHGYLLDDKINHYVVTDPFISDDRFLIRTQYWIYAHNLDPESNTYVQAFLNGNCPSWGQEIPMAWACRHFSTNSNVPIYDFDRPEEAARLRRCNECAFEYQIETVRQIPVNWTSVSPAQIADESFCAVVTLWRDFGRCLTPYDPRWAAHFVEYTEPYFTSCFPAENQQLRNPDKEEPANDWELGDIRRAYERCDELIETERSLHRSVLKLLLSTEEQRKVLESADVRKENLRELESKSQRGL